jgi:hypothetical protein
MQATNGLNLLGDIGGPMDIGNGYRWNVPIITYGFDKSFVDYFGSNGVSAVESAIQTLNDLPPASQMVLTNFPSYTTRVNYAAQSQSLTDLKSTTLSLLLEQMGLAPPSRCIVAIKQWNPLLYTGDFADDVTQEDAWAFPDYLVRRNFDPLTLSPSTYINGIPYVSFILPFFSTTSGLSSQRIIYSYAEDPIDPSFTAVADIYEGTFGNFYTGLTQDDVGGIHYLFSTNNVNYEELLPDVRGVGRHRKGLVRGAQRPGIDKITFVRQPQDSRAGRFLPMFHPYTDRYITNGAVMTQEVERVITKPDFVFAATNLTSRYGSVYYSGLYYARTGTTNWVNNSTLNGSSEGGPGVIAPQVTISFATIGHVVFWDTDDSASSFPNFWGSYDGSTNVPIAYPPSPQGIRPHVINMALGFGGGFDFTNTFFQWPVTNLVGSVSLFQTSTNLIDWVTMFSATNDGTSWYFNNSNPSSKYRFYRVISP